MIRKILGRAMFIQKNSGLLKNNTARNMTQNKWRSRWCLALVNLLVIGGAVVIPGELVLGKEKHPCKPYPICVGDPDWPGVHSEPAEIPGVDSEVTPHKAAEIFGQIKQRYPKAIQQLLKDDPRAMQKLRLALPILQKLQELAPESKRQIQELISNHGRQERRLNHRRQHLNQSENNKE